MSASEDCNEAELFGASVSDIIELISFLNEQKDLINSAIGIFSACIVNFAGEMPSPEEIKKKASFVSLSSVSSSLNGISGDYVDTESCQNIISGTTDSMSKVEEYSREWFILQANGAASVVSVLRGGIGAVMSELERLKDRNNPVQIVMSVDGFSLE